MALTEIHLKIRRFHGFLSQKGSRPLIYSDNAAQFLVTNSDRLTRTYGYKRSGVMHLQEICT